MSNLEFPWLPEEILPLILHQFPPSRESDESVIALFTCAASSRVLRAAATSQSLWQPHYRIRYTHESSSVKPYRQQRYNGDYYQMYSLRRGFDKAAIRKLDDMEHFEGKADRRHEHAQEIIKLYSYDVWDVLDIERSRPVPWSLVDGQDPPRATTLTRRWWATNLIGTITRHDSINTWMGLLEGAQPPVTLEQAFNALSGFFDHSAQRTELIFDSLAIEAENYLADLDVRISSTSLTDISKHILSFMQSKGFGPANGTQFSNIMNSFPHHYLSPDGHQSLPLSLVHVFCALCNRLGLDGRALDFPMRVLARVMARPDHDEEDIIVDVYGSSEPNGKAILTESEGIPDMLRVSGTPLDQKDAYLEPGKPVPLLLRTTRNMINSLSQLPHEALSINGDDNVRSVMYAAMAVKAIFESAPEAAQQLPQLLPYAPLDARPIFDTLLAQRLPWRVGQKLNHALHSFLEVEKEESIEVTRRTAATKNVKHFVGEIFKHKEYDYIGIVVGWTTVCMASEEWITGMNVDRLQGGGRKQPFYYVLNRDGSRRYVANCNITTIDHITDEVAEDFVQHSPTLAANFIRMSPEAPHGRRRFLLSAEAKTCYPDDDEFGRTWLETGEMPSGEVDEEGK